MDEKEAKYQSEKRIMEENNIKVENGELISLYPIKVSKNNVKRFFEEKGGLTKEEKEYFDLKHRDKRLEKIKQQSFMFIANRQEEKATELIVELIENENNIYSTRDDIKSEIWFYEDGVYVPNGKSKIQELTRNILGELYTPQRVNKIIAKIEADTKIDSDEFFNNEKNIEEIPVENGILNLETLDLSPFTPEKIFFNKLPVKFDVEADCPNIEKFFKEILKSEDDSEVMFELFGYCLWKEHFIEKGFMFVGDGRNGKGKTISLLKHFLGIKNCCSVPLEQMKSESTSICELHGMLANLAGDISDTSLKKTGMFKEITGRDLIGAKRKWLRDLFFINYSKQIFACNQLPKVYDFSEGFWERWILLEFPYKFIPKSQYDDLGEEEKPKHKIRDVDIINKLTTEKELSGLLNRAIVGLKNLQKNKKFSYSKGSAEVKDFWIRKSDSFTAFCFDMLKEDFEGHISKKHLRRHFSKYCKKYGVKGASDKAIKVVLEDMFGVTDNYIEIGGKQQWVWEGIGWKENI